MEVHFSPEQEARLTKLAAAKGTDPDRLVQEIVGRTLADDARFREDVQRGLEQADRGDLLDEEEMDDRVQRMFSR
jgi:predicted transcriptional regulator